MRLGLVCSGGASSFRHLVHATAGRDVTFHVVTDRECGVEAFCADAGITNRRFVERDNSAFSRAARAEFDAVDVDAVLLFYNRLVTAELYRGVPTLNVHPALLPAFPGLTAIDSALRRRVRFLGATLHLVNAVADDGPIVAQVCAPLDPDWPRQRVEELSFVQRTYLTLLAYELLESKSLVFTPDHADFTFAGPMPHSSSANPALRDTALLRYMRDLEEERRLAPRDE